MKVKEEQSKKRAELSEEELAQVSGGGLPFIGEDNPILLEDN